MNKTLIKAIGSFIIGYIIGLIIGYIVVNNDKKELPEEPKMCIWHEPYIQCTKNEWVEECKVG